MEVTIQHGEKTINIIHDADTTSATFPHNGNNIELLVIGAANNKRAKQIDVQSIKIVRDQSGEILKSERIDYTIIKSTEYMMFYNMPTVPDKGLGFTEYMHALNGVIARCPELGGNNDGGGIRPFNADGTIKPEFAAE